MSPLLPSDSFSQQDFEFPETKTHLNCLYLYNVQSSGFVHISVCIFKVCKVRVLKKLYFGIPIFWWFL